MSLANKALLANLRISQWAGRKLDKGASSLVHNNYGAASGTGNYTKKLLPGAKELEEITKLTGSMRQFFYDQTLPWLSEGTRILKSDNYINFTTEYRMHESALKAAWLAFLNEYETLRDNAQVKLGSLFRASDYPMVSELRKSFQCEMSFMPIPIIDDFRVQILDSEKDAFLQRMRETESRAMTECWTRLHDVVTKASARLQQPDAIFRDSLIDNISEMCQLLPRLNISDDPDLEHMRKQVEGIVAGISAESVRASVITREDAAKKLSDISAKMADMAGLV